MTSRLPEHDERLADWVDGRLSERDRERLEAEFGVNPELRAAAERYRASVAKIRGALQEFDQTVDLSDKIMAGLTGTADQQPARRRLLPLMASAGAAAAIIMTYFALQYMPEFGDELSPAPATKVAAEPRQQNEADDLVPAADQTGSVPADDAPAELQRASRARSVDRVANKLDAPGRVAPEMDPRLGARRELFSEVEAKAAPESIEQVLRDALKSSAYEVSDTDQSRVAGQQARELVLVVEMPQVAFANLRADIAAAKPAAPESRMKLLEKSKDKLAQDLWRQEASRFMQQPLQQAQFQTMVSPPRVRSSYFDPSQGSGIAIGKAGAGSEIFVPLTEDIYFEVEGDEQQILAYLRELYRLTELGKGRVLSQWTNTGAIQGLPIGGTLSVSGRLSGDKKNVPSQRRQHFVLRQRK